MLRYSLKQLRYFITAAELNSTSKAARLLHVSQPSISMAIQQLESLFGQALILRHKGQGIMPTPYGREIMLKGRHLLELAHNLPGTQEDSLKGSILLGCFTDISPYYLPRIIREIQKHYPELTLNVIAAELSEIPALLKRGELDLALTYGILLDSDIYQESLSVSAPHALLPANHPLTEQTQVSLQQLLNEPFIRSNAPYSSDFLLTVLTSMGYQPNIAYNARTFELLRSMVANGLGVSLAYTLPRSLQSYDGKLLAYRPIKEPLPSQNIVLVRHQTAQLTASTQAIWRIIIKQFTHPAIQ